MHKWTSRKFWMAIGTIIVTVAVGLGYTISPELRDLLTGADSVLWSVIESIIDIMGGN